MLFSKKNLVKLSAVALVATMIFTGCGNKGKEASNEVKLNDGTYSKVAEEADSNGYTYECTLVVEDGKITSVKYDGVDANGKSKSQASFDGEYVMTEDGLTWGAQAEALASYVVEKQSLEGLTVNEEGKTDVVSGVSISINGFIEYVEDCLEQASK